MKIHNLYVVRGTDLDSLYRRGEYTPLGLAEYAGRAAEFMAHLPAGTVIHRVTGEAPAELLAAPAWTLKKQAVIKAIREELERR